MTAPPLQPSFDETAEKVRMLLATSRRLMAEGRLVDLTQIEGKIKILCDLARDLPDARQASARQILEILLDEIDIAQNELEEQFGTALSERPHREAAQAYAKGEPSHRKMPLGEAPPSANEADKGDAKVEEEAEEAKAKNETGGNIDDGHP